MKRVIFLDLNTNYFWSTVLCFCQENELQAKTLILLENAPQETTNFAEVRTPLDVNVVYIFLNIILMHPFVFVSKTNKYWGGQHIFIHLCSLDSIKQHITLWTTGQGINTNFEAYYLHLDFMEMVRVLERSHKIIKNYWHSSDILKGINNLNTAWEVVSVKCLKGVWHKRLPQFVHNFIG
jgi:hypothetical protein